MALDRRTSAAGVAAVLTMLATQLVAAPAKASTAMDEQHTFTSSAGSMSYVLHVPAHDGPIPLLVYLHGCGAPPSVPGLDAMADAHGFAVAYPVESSTPGGDGCWNWTTDRHRDQGQAALVAGLTQEVVLAHGLDPARVYLSGHSAGSGMTANLVAAYPDLYAAAAIIAGCGRLSCADVTGLTAFREMGPRARAVPVYMLWGTKDRTNPYLTGRMQLLQWQSMNDLADDGRANLSVPRLPSAVTAHPAQGGTPAYLVERYAGRTAEVVFVSVVGMDHVPDARWRPAFPDMVDFLLATG